MKISKIYLSVVSVFVSVLFISCTDSIAQKGKKSTKHSQEKQNIVLVKGTIHKKPWAKSGQSYCAQGSGYFVIALEEGDEIVLSYDKAIIKDLSSKDGKTVTLKGHYKTKKIVNDDPYSQKPVSSPFPGGESDNTYTCEVFRIIDIIK
jgi:hypothetical protein